MFVSNLIKAALKDFLVYLGDTTPGVVELYENAGSIERPKRGDPINLSGNNLIISVSSLDCHDVYKVTGLQVSLSGSNQNIISVTGFEALKKGKYLYEITAIEGAEKVTYLTGKIIVVDKGSSTWQ